jgi:predicted ATPase/DNA-binding SARP family transcriptional activator
VGDVEFRLLGAVQVRRGGELITVGRGSTLNLLAGLLVHANETISVDALAELIWGSAQPAHPRAAVHSKVSRLRRLLGENIIETAGHSYILRADPEQLDLLRFNDLLSRAAGAGSPEDARDALAGAIELWRGAPLSNIDSATLLNETVQGLTERYLVACEQWADVCSRLGQPAVVAERLTPVVAGHPFRESLAWHLLIALHRTGRRADALALYDSVRRALRDGLGVDPSTALHDLYLRILQSDEPVFAVSPGHQPRWAGRRPAPGELIGRAADEHGLARSLASYHAVTVVGAAGVGKTELALHTAATMASGFAEGVAVAELGPLPAQSTDDLQAVSGALLTVISGSAESTRPASEVLLEELRSREMLVVLDNAEHVFIACSRLVDLITRSCAGIRIITTSRRPLGFAGERVIGLTPLGPHDAEKLLRIRIDEHGGDAGTIADSGSMAMLCELLDGFPLAVELAAARLRTMSASDLIERITQRPGLLTVEGRPGLPHQRGLSATLRWSYDLLTEQSQLLLRRLAVFGGPLSLEQAEQVCGYPPLAQGDVAVLLSGLANDSLVQVADAAGTRRYRLFVPVRDFAVSEASDAELAAARASHLRHFCATAESIENSGTETRAVLIERLLDDYCEILAALEWSLSEQAPDSAAGYGARLLLAAEPVWKRRQGAFLIALSHAVRALRRSAALTPSLAVDVTLLAGRLNMRTGDLAAAKPLLEEVRERLDDQNSRDRQRRMAALSFLAAIGYARVDPEAVDLIRQTAEEARDIGDRETVVFRLSVGAGMLAALGHVGEALSLISEAGRSVGDDLALRRRHLARRAYVYLRAGWIGESLRNLDELLADRSHVASFDLVEAMVSRGFALMRRGHFAVARESLAEGIRLAGELQTPTLLPDLSLAMAATETAAGNLPQAIAHVREALSWSLPRSDVIDTVGALHLAVVLSVKTGNPRAADIAAAVRLCRLHSGLPPWPVPESDYAAYEKELGVGTLAVAASSLRLDEVTRAGELALRSLVP